MLEGDENNLPNLGIEMEIKRQKSDFVPTLSEDEAIAMCQEVRDLDAGQLIFSEGDTGDFVCFITKGILDVLKKNEKGKNAVIASLNRGRSLGEMALLDDYPRSATVRAKTRSTLLILTRKGFEQVLEKHPQIGIKMLKGLAKILSMNLRKTSSLLADYMLPMG